MVQVYDAGDDEYTVRMIEGESLLERLATGLLPIAEALRFLARVAEALANVPAKGVVHLDLKPANIIVSQAPRSATVAATSATRVVVLTEAGLQPELDRAHP